MLLVIDINSNRVIFYTSDRSASLVLTKNTGIVDYSGSWPEEITLTNCFNWILVGKELKHLETYKNQQGLSVLEINRAAYIDNVNNITNKLRSSFIDLDVIKAVLAETTDRPLATSLSKSTGHSVNTIVSIYQNKLNEYTEFLRLTEFVRNRFTTAFELCRSNSELIFVKSMFDSAKRSSNYVDSPFRDLLRVEKSSVEVLDFLNEIMAFPDTAWTTDQIDSRQDTKIAHIRRPVPTDDLYPTNYWNTQEISNTVLASQCENLMNYLNNFATEKNKILKRVFVGQLAGDEDVLWSVDIGEYYQHKNRYVLCLNGQFELTVLHNSKIIIAGELVYFDNKMPHMSQGFDTTRYAVFFDLENAT